MFGLRSNEDILETVRAELRISNRVLEIYNKRTTDSLEKICDSINEVAKRFDDVRRIEVESCRCDDILNLKKENSRLNNIIKVMRDMGLEADK